MAILVYVNDIILAGNVSHACTKFKDYLDACSSIKDLGPLKYFSGIEVARASKGSFLSQCKYTVEVVDECVLLGCKPNYFPIKENHNLALAAGPTLTDSGRYRSLVGRLIYLTITRFDLCYTMHILSQFMQNPRDEHMNAACRVLRHIKGTPDCGILL